MTVTFGYYTLLGFLVGTLVPSTLVLVWWVYCTARIRLSVFFGIGGELSPYLVEVMFEAQYFPFALLQPVSWAVPWIKRALLGALPLGVILDSWAMLIVTT